ncbi:MAG: alpha-hydroxy acid oxidase [Pseudomonadota bacterium]
MTKLNNTYPSIWHLAERARKRIPFFAWEYLDSGTGMERLVERNRAALDAVRMMPRVLSGRFAPNMSVTLLGETYSVPFGIAPIGLSSLMWPEAELILAKAAQKNDIPYCLSMVANQTPERVTEFAPDRTWMQIYPPSKVEILHDLLARSKAAGIKTIVITVDVPASSTRERQLAAGLTVPPKTTAKTLWRMAKRPAWLRQTMAKGKPRFRTMESYFPEDQMNEAAKLIANIVDGRPDWDYLDIVRKAWDGNLIVKGVLSVEDAGKAITHGADAIVVSNHGGRQFDAAPASIKALPAIAEKVAKRVPVIFDSGIRGGLDIARAIALGADFCLLGRAFLYSVAALGDEGGDHAYEILRNDLANNMIQAGAKTLGDLTAL